jgi:hypothetical protein
VAVRFVAVYVCDVAALMFVNVLLSVLDCHWIVPVLPESVNVVLFVPVHTVAPPLMVPATDIGVTVATTAVLEEDTQPVIVFLDCA